MNNDGTPIAPRPGVNTELNLTIRLDDPVELNQRELGIIESDINDKFREPNELGDIAITFNTDVMSAFFNILSMKTNASTLESKHVEQIADIVEKHVNTTVKNWSISAKLRRKASVVDYI